MTLENQGEIYIVSYGDNVYYRLQYTDGDCCWCLITYNDFFNRITLNLIEDIKTKNQLESVWLMNDVKYQNNEVNK